MNNSSTEFFVFDPRRLRQNLLVNHSKKYVFIDNPKSASSTVKMELWDLERAEGRKSGEPLPTSIHGAPFLRTSYGREILGYLAFAVVRNPYARVLSAYLDKIVSEPATGNIFRKQARIGSGASVTFPEFVKILSQSTTIEDDRHWTEQYDNLLQGCFRIDLLGSVENLDGFLAAFAERYGVEKVHPNRSRHATGAVEKVCRYYDEETRQMVAEKYRRDFETFGYSYDLADAREPPALDGKGLEETPRRAELAWASLELDTEPGAIETLREAARDPACAEFCRGALALRRIFEDAVLPLEEEGNPLVIRGLVSRLLNTKDFEGAERAAKRLIEVIPQWREGWVAMAAVAKSKGIPDAENVYLDEALLMTWDPGADSIRKRVQGLASPRRRFRESTGKAVSSRKKAVSSRTRLLRRIRKRVARLLGR